jgi:hypothetical protein
MVGDIRHDGAEGDHVWGGGSHHEELPRHQVSGEYVYEHLRVFLYPSISVCVYPSISVCVYAFVHVWGMPMVTPCLYSDDSANQIKSRDLRVDSRPLHIQYVCLSAFPFAYLCLQVCEVI